MEIQYINVGTSEDTGDGDVIRDAFIKCNHNFELLLNDERQVFNGSVKSVDGKLLVDGINGWIPYTPATPSNWPTMPLNMSAALDQLSNAFSSTIEGPKEQVQVSDVSVEQQSRFTFSNPFIGFPMYGAEGVVVYHNGVRLLYGPNRDYTVPAHNQIDINYPARNAVDIGDTVTVVSRNFQMTHEYTV